MLVTYAYDQGFTQRDQGYAAAIGMVLLAVTLAFTAVQWRHNRGRDGDAMSAVRPRPRPGGRSCSAPWPPPASGSSSSSRSTG